MPQRKGAKARSPMQRWVQRLLDGEAGAVIVAEMREYYRTDCSLMTQISAARRLFMTAELKGTQRNVNPSLASSIKELRRESERLGHDHPCAQMIQKFVHADLRTKYAEWRRRPYLQPGCVHTPPVQRIFKQMRILPTNMDSFHVPMETLQECIAESEDARLDKNETQTFIADPDAIVGRLAALLRTPEKGTLSELVVALCAVSGRRLGEIASPHSRFEHMTPRYAHGVVFTGQLKRSGILKQEPYAVPLIRVTSEVFLNGVRNLRTRQDPALGQRDQQFISSLYQSNARKYLKKHFPMFTKNHELRAFYCRYVWNSFDWGRLSFPRVVMYILGHKSLNYFVNYNSIEFATDSRYDRYGPFPVDITASRSRGEGRLTLRERKANEHAANRAGGQVAPEGV